MKQQLYLNNQIPKFIISQTKKTNYLRQYNWIRIKRFIIHTAIIFIFQFLIISNLNFQYPTLPLPMYPPIGIAFIMFYLFGTNALAGLLLSGLFGYFLHANLHHINFLYLFLYLLADILGPFSGVALCQNIFSSDIKPLANNKELLQFIKKNAFITCLISSLIRTIAIILTYQSKYDFKILLYNYIDLWLADLNAILIIAGCILSWTYVPFNRHNISHLTIKKFPIIILILFIIFSILFMKKFELIYLIAIAMITSIYSSHYYGNLIATILLFIVSCIYLTYFIAFQHQYLVYFGALLYTLIPIVLLLFTICMLYTNLIFNKKMLGLYRI